jgi:hypothetical protein
MMEMVKEQCKKSCETRGIQVTTNYGCRAIANVGRWTLYHFKDYQEHYWAMGSVPATTRLLISCRGLSSMDW